jgi:hypothetical protein
MVPLDPAAMVADLRIRAKKLLDAAAAIEEAYGSRNTGKTRENGRGGRRTQLIEYLREHGPMKRTELIANSGVPAGTIAHLLRDGEAFEPDGNGGWRVKGTT